MKQRFISALAILLVIIVLVNGCSSKESSSKTGVGASQQDASQLTGLWRAEKALTLNFQTQKLEERKTSALDFTEFKDGQVCTAIGSASDNAFGTGKYSFECSGYAPYTVSGDKLIIEGEDTVITWRLTDGKLETTFKRTARDPVPFSKVIYRKLSDAEIYRTGEPVNGKIPIRVEGTPIQN